MLEEKTTLGNQKRRKPGKEPFLVSSFPGFLMEFVGHHTLLEMFT
jgi:hypothetical protein